MVPPDVDTPTVAPLDVTTEFLNHPRNPFVVEEHGRVPVPVSELLVHGKLALYPEVTGRGYFRVDLVKDKLEFQAGGWIGLIPVTDRVTIEVRPRVPVHNLERLLAIVEHRPVSLAPHLRQFARSDLEVPPLLDLLADALLDALTPVERFGLLREYRELVEDSSFPSGRIHVGTTLQRHRSRGIRHRVRMSRIEQSVDTGANRCLKFALWYLSRRFRELQPRAGKPQLLTRLNRAYRMFDGVALDEARRFLSDPYVARSELLPSLRSYYGDALRIALTIIEHGGVMLRGEGSDVKMASWVISMDKVFEDYVRITLRDRLLDLSPTVSVLDGNASPPGGGSKKLFDEPSPSPNLANPDVVIARTDPDGSIVSHPLILEVKYKRSAVPDRSDLEQAIVYAVSYRAPAVLIVMPRFGVADRPELSLVGVLDSVRVYRYAFDLGSELPVQAEKDLEGAVRSFLSIE